MKKIELKIVNTVKIQSVKNNRKTTRRRFNFEVKLPEELEDIVKSYFDDVVNEILAEQRSPEDWVKLIETHIISKQLQGWIASIIWWVYGGDNDNVLYELSKSYDHWDCKYKIADVKQRLDDLHCPRFVCEEAAKREKKRNKEMKEYLKRFEPVKLEKK